MTLLLYSYCITGTSQPADTENHKLKTYYTSEDIKWGLRKSFQNPNSKYYQRVCYGYTHDQEGRLIIHEEQAEIVRLIYEMSASGASSQGYLDV